jgi:hypothetical protein
MEIGAHLGRRLPPSLKQGRLRASVQPTMQKRARHDQWSTLAAGSARLPRPDSFGSRLGWARVGCLVPRYAIRCLSAVASKCLTLELIAAVRFAHFARLGELQERRADARAAEPRVVGELACRHRLAAGERVQGRDFRPTTRPVTGVIDPAPPAFAAGVFAGVDADLDPFLGRGARGARCACGRRRGATGASRRRAAGGRRRVRPSLPSARRACRSLSASRSNSSSRR